MVRKGVLWFCALILACQICLALSISDVSISELTDRSVRISWRTDVPADSKINYGTAKDALNMSVFSLEKTMQHSLLLLGLKADTLYYFEVVSSDGVNVSVDNNTGDFYGFRTLAEDVIPPFIDVEIPAYVPERVIDISGRTEPGTFVMVYVNGEPVRAAKFDDGEITFSAISLDSGQNVILLKATDPSNNTNQSSFAVFADTIPPELWIAPLPDFSKIKTIALRGNVSEHANVTVELNKQVVYSKFVVGAFETGLSLIEGENNLSVKAVDRAGHAALFDKTIIYDITKPTIEIEKPTSGAFFYEGRAVADIEGNTEPYADVMLYVESAVPKNKIATAQADSTGRFIFRNVNFDELLEKEDFKPEIKQQNITYEGEEVTVKEQVRSLKIVLIAKDRAGLISDPAELVIQIGTCWSGEFDIDIDVPIDYQFPTLLNPERLKDGTEIISFIVKLAYRGGKENWAISSLRLEPACKGVGAFGGGDKRFELACKILPSSPEIIRSNPDRTMWYVRYRLDSTDVFANFTEATWKAFKERELAFPFKAIIRYGEGDPGAEMVTKWQTQCFAPAYFVDIPIDPRKVLPDWMLKDGVRWLNKSIQRLEKLEKQIDRVRRIVGTGCLYAMGARFVTRWLRKFECEMESIQKFIAPGQEKSCPAKKKRMALKTSTKTKLSSARRDLLDNYAGYTLEQLCPGCASAWKTEEGIYRVMRWLCDRIFCHRVPAAWTAKAKRSDIRKAEERAKGCGATYSSGLTPLIPVENCNTVYKDNLRKDYKEIQKCWLYRFKGKEALYAWHSQEGRYHRFVRIDNFGTAGPPSELWAVKEGNRYGTAIALSCDELCKQSGHGWQGRCMLVKNCLSEAYGGFARGYTTDCWKRQAALEQNKTCCCWQPKKEEAPAMETAEWEYREQQLYREVGYKTKGPEYGTNYPDWKYISKRDLPACFGADHWLSKYITGQEQGLPWLDPSKDFWAGLQCACLSRIEAEIGYWKAVFTGLRNCLNQIKKTGRADSGLCKEFFAQHVCNLLYQIWVAVKEGCIPVPLSAAKIKIGNVAADVAGSESPFRIGLAALGDALTSTARDIESEYGETVLTNFLAGGERAIMRKICLAAFGFDVGFDLDAALDVGYTFQYATSPIVMARREFLTHDPDTKQSTYEYRLAWTFYPGCDIQSYDIELVCVDDDEIARNPDIVCSEASNPNNPQGCDCAGSELPEGRRSRHFYRGGAVATGAIEDRDESKVIDSIRRYDHVKLTLHLAKGFDPKKCFPEGHEDGVFYFPINDITPQLIVDCELDVLDGEFECGKGLLWDAKGQAWFEPYPGCARADGMPCWLVCLDPIKGVVDCSDAAFGIGNSVRIRAFVQTTGPKQCLFYKAATGVGESIEGMLEIAEIEGGGRFATPWIDLDTVKDEHLGKGSFVSDCAGFIEHAPPDEMIAPGMRAIVKFERLNTKVRITPSAGQCKMFDPNGRELGCKAIEIEPDKIRQWRFVLYGLGLRFTGIPLTEGQSERVCAIDIYAGDSAVGQRTWSIYTELRHPNADRCDDATEMIRIAGKRTSLTGFPKIFRSLSGVDVSPGGAAVMNRRISITMRGTLDQILREFVSKLGAANDKTIKLAYCGCNATEGEKPDWSSISLDVDYRDMPASSILFEIFSRIRADHALGLKWMLIEVPEMKLNVCEEPKTRITLQEVRKGYNEANPAKSNATIVFLFEPEVVKKDISASLDVNKTKDGKYYGEQYYTSTILEDNQGYKSFFIPDVNATELQEKGLGWGIYLYVSKCGWEVPTHYFSVDMSKWQKQ